jgi:tungstate transport system substrate-binding protein
MENGDCITRKLVMHNDFIIVGPAADPAGISGMSDAVAALTAIAESGSTFVSRGDNSGTHKMELSLWSKAAVEPAGQDWYQQSGQGMGATLTITSEMEAYTLTDRATYWQPGQISALIFLRRVTPFFLTSTMSCR